MTEKERMDKGLLYLPEDEDIFAFQLKCLDKIYEYNHTLPSDLKKRSELLKEMCASIGDNTFFEIPVHSNFGLKHVHVGSHCFFNYNCMFVDDGNIYIGNDCMFAPNVIIATASHPIDADLRKAGYQFNKDVHIGNNVWVGSGVKIMPGVTIGDNTVIGAGSVVTKDIPSGVVAFGNPCKVHRLVSEHDKEYFYKNEKIDYTDLKI